MLAAITDDERFTMINLRGRSTGLKMNVWLGGAHIKVQTSHNEKFDFKNLAVVDLNGHLIEGDLNADDLESVRRYITLNKEAILSYCKEMADGVELLRAVKSLS